MVASLLAVLLVAGHDEVASRRAPPAAVTCPRDHLTSYTGRVVSYRRTPETLLLTIHTDWDTTERVTLAPVRLEQLRMGGAPFAAEDWARLEAAPGDPRPGLRATAWMCDDGRPPLIDWQPLGKPTSPE
jgi:hypothetical protein